MHLPCIARQPVKENSVFGLLRRTPEERAQDDAKIQASLAKTRQSFLGRISAIFQANEVADDTWDEL